MKVQAIDVVERMQARREQLNADLQVTPDVDTACEIEARSMLRELPKAELWRALDNAVQDGNAVVFAAFLGSPVPWPALDDKMMAKAKRKWSEQRNPAVAKEYADLDVAIAALSSDLRELTAWVNKVGRLSDGSLRERLRSMAPDALAEAEQLRNRSIADQLAGKGNRSEHAPNVPVG